MVLPSPPQKGCKRWLLKMHGCIRNPDSIVFTKQDYIRYADRYAALAGIVQSMLLTKHLLFVGFSLDDDNFIRIFDSVRKAVHPYTTNSNPYSNNMNNMNNSDTGGGSGGAMNIFKSVTNNKAQQKMKMKYWDFNDQNRTGSCEEEVCCGTALLLEHSKWKVSICICLFCIGSYPLVVLYYYVVLCCCMSRKNCGRV